MTGEDGNKQRPSTLDEIVEILQSHSAAQELEWEIVRRLVEVVGDLATAEAERLEWLESVTARLDALEGERLVFDEEGEPALHRQARQAQLHAQELSKRTNELAARANALLRESEEVLVSRQRGTLRREPR